MKPPVIRTDTGKVAVSILAGWGLDWADTIAAIEGEAMALKREPPHCDLNCDACRSADGEIPVGTWFRLRWTTGRVGRWHRAGMMMPHLTQQYCRCGRGVLGHGQRRYSLVMTETTTETPAATDRCNAWADR